VKDSGAWNELVGDEMVVFEGDLITEEGILHLRFGILAAFIASHIISDDEKFTFFLLHTPSQPASHVTSLWPTARND